MAESYGGKISKLIPELIVVLNNEVILFALKGMIYVKGMHACIHHITWEAEKG